LLESIGADHCHGTVGNLSAIEEHVNHAGDYRGSRSFSASKVSAPLANNHEVHVAKEHCKQDDLRYKFEKEVKLVFEVNCIECLHTDTE